MTIQFRTSITFHSTQKKNVHFLSKSIINSLWWAVVAMAFVE